MTALGIPQIRKFVPAESVMGHEHQFPPPRLSGRCGIRKRSFAGDGPGQLGFWGQALTGNDAGAFPGYLQSRPSPSRRASRATANLTTLVSFNDADGAHPAAVLIADADGNLLGTTNQFGPNGNGTVFEITDSGFVVPPIFAGTPGKPNCFGRSVSALARQYGGLNAAAEALGYPSVRALQQAIREFCEG